VTPPAATRGDNLAPDGSRPLDGNGDGEVSLDELLSSLAD